GRDRLHQRVTLVDVLDGELHALELVGPLGRVATGERHAGAGVDGAAGRAGRPRADRRLVGGERLRGESHGKREPAGDAQTRTQEIAPALALRIGTVVHVNLLR